ncbi:MAG TPA: FAD-dependent oxidoreductase, partial [Acidimicrobiales bacterium]|nr:FAD-dependent oxidoreductase [Acidimicrobiales bacterium]
AVVGASLAGLRAAETLRAEGHRGPVVVIGAETHLPYDRPPLSKQFLAGAWDVDRVRLRSPEKIDALGLDLRLGRSAVSLDLEGHGLVLDDGSRVGFDAMVVATGSVPRPLGGTEGVAGVHELRTLDDSVALARALAPALAGDTVRLVVVGAGFIGAEVAATAHGLGARVTVVEALAVPLGRVLGDEMGALCGELQRDHGVQLRTGVGVAGLRTETQAQGRRVTGVELADGDVLPADVVVVGIGVLPATAWLEGSGLEVDNGVVVDATLHAGDAVVAAGDLARWFDVGSGSLRRVEHWTNAAEQGAAAARNLLAGRRAAVAYEPVPYFWSDQYDVKIQMIGYPSSDDVVVVVDGSPSERRFVALYGRSGEFHAALGFGRPRQLMAYRPLLEAKAGFDEALALDVG